MSNEKNKVEALLFSAGRKMDIEELSSLSKIRDYTVLKGALRELKEEYEAKGSSLMLFEEGNSWKLTVREHYLPLVHGIVTQTELERPLVETLAVIAWKYPVLQADVIKIRHNKAYEHLKQLEEIGFITRQKFGRTNKITLTQKFFDYFDLPNKEQAQGAFKEFVPEEVRQAVDGAEKEVDEVEKAIEEAKEKQEKQKKELEEQKKREKDELEAVEQLNEMNNPEEENKTENVSEAVEELKEDINEEEEKDEKELDEIGKELEKLAESGKKKKEEDNSEEKE